MVISILVIVEFAALTWLSRFSQPPTVVLLVAYGAAFGCYLGLLAYARETRLPLWAMFAAAILMRLPWIFTGVSLSDDIWRYLHDGRAQLAGINPFLYAPADSAATAYAGPEHALINNPELPTIYPPFAQLMFHLSGLMGSTVLSWKILIVLFDLGIAGGIVPLLRRRGLPSGLVAAYLFHPLPIIEFAGNGHVDAIAICTMILALALAGRHTVLAGVAFAASVAAKYLALPLGPFLLRNLNRSGRMKLVLAGAAALVLWYSRFTDPLPIGSLGVFARTFTFNGPIAAGLSALITPGGARWFTGVSLLTLLTGLWLRKRDPADVALVFIAAVLLCSPIVHPWYLTWIVPFLALRRETWIVTWTGTVVFAYAVLPQWWAAQIWHLPTWALVLEYLPVYALAVAAMIAAIRRSK
jgi:hypothetical protein